MPEAGIFWQQLAASDWQQKLGDYCREMLRGRSRIILCITGRAGSGKSTLGRYLRKNGLPGVPKGGVAVIDDCVLFAPLFGILPRRVRYSSKDRDELTPFMRYLGKKHLIVYVNAHPEVRLSRCDILLRLECAEETRRERLINREIGGERRFSSTSGEQDVDLPCEWRLILASHEGVFSKM